MASKRGRRGVAVLLVAVLATTVLALTATARTTGTMTGRVVSSETGRGAALVFVLAYREPITRPEAVTITDLRGRFTLSGLTGEEYGVRFLGLRRFESGWLSCSPYQVVPSFDDACTHAPMDFGRILIDPR